MRNFTHLAFFSLLTILAPGCLVVSTGPNVDQSYDSCVPGDVCADGNFTCESSTLGDPSFTGSFCTAACTANSGCPEDVSGFPTVCVLYAQGLGQCYLTCPTGNTCPYGQGCFAYQDAFTGNLINLCTP